MSWEEARYEEEGHGMNMSWEEATREAELAMAEAHGRFPHAPPLAPMPSRAQCLRSAELLERAAKEKGKILVGDAMRGWHEVVVYEADKSWPDYHRAYVFNWSVHSHHENHTAVLRIQGASVLLETEEEMWNWDPEEDPDTSRLYDDEDYERRPLKARRIRGAFAAAANGSATEDQVAVVRAIAALVDLDTLAIVPTKRSPRSRRSRIAAQRIAAKRAESGSQRSGPKAEHSGSCQV